MMHHYRALFHNYWSHNNCGHRQRCMGIGFSENFFLKNSIIRLLSFFYALSRMSENYDLILPHHYIDLDGGREGFVRIFPLSINSSMGEITAYSCSFAYICKDQEISFTGGLRKLDVGPQIELHFFVSPEIIINRYQPILSHSFQVSFAVVSPLIFCKSFHSYS